MRYNYLDEWDIQLIKDNTNDLEDLLLVIDDLIGVASDNAFELGQQEGYDEGYDQAFLNMEEE